jgi:endonuclease/exonuclease/phosphatase (EEP) superfamily protein YafD
MLLAMEVNDWWNERLAVLKRDYPHQIEYPADNGYGMSLYSRLPLIDPEIEFLKRDSIPSFHTEVEFSGGNFVFHGVHPLAPVPSDRFPDGAGNEEVALIEVADKVDTYPLPSIVAGDFNDVSWSNTSRLFGEQTDLRNVRLGRGVYPTFNAHSIFMRWPLDHYFVSEEFRLAELRRLPKFGSDHFAMYAAFELAGE